MMQCGVSVVELFEEDLGERAVGEGLDFAALPDETPEHTDSF
jgi:hypothetical protein